MQIKILKLARAFGSLTQTLCNKYIYIDIEYDMWVCIYIYIGGKKKR